MVPPFTLDTSPPSQETLKIAEEELRETPENVKNALAELRQLLADDNTIYYGDSDEILTIFLRPCKWYAKSAYELMKRIADFKEKHKDLLDNLLPMDEQDAFCNNDVVNVLKDRDHKGRRVLVVNCGSTWDPKRVSSDQIFRMFFLIHLAAVLEPETQIRGCVVIMDYNGMGMQQVKGLSPSFSMKLLGFIQEAMPLRLKEVHMVKEPFVFKMVWAMFKPFIKEKLKGRIHFHGSNMKSLHKFMAPSHLPSDYGGELDKIDYSGKDWFPCIEGHIDHFKLMNTFGLKKKE